MQLTDLVPVEPLQIKESSAAQGLLSRILTGNKNLSKAQLREIRQYVNKGGYEKFDPNKGFFRGLLLGSGKSPLKTVKSRFQQGGVLGKGGVLRGELAFNPEFYRSAKRVARGKASGKDYLKTLGYGAGGALNAGFLLGFPAYAGYQLLTDPNPKSPGATMGMELGTSLGYLAGGPLGMLGGIGAGIAGGMLGGAAGSRLDSKPIKDFSQYADIPAGPMYRIQNSGYDPSSYSASYYDPYSSANLAPLPLENEYSYELSPQYSNNGLALGQY